MNMDDNKYDLEDNQREFLTKYMELETKDVELMWDVMVSRIIKEGYYYESDRMYLEDIRRDYKEISKGKMRTRGFRGSF